MKMENLDSEKESLINTTETESDDTKTGVYTRRWWILFVYCGCVMSEGLTFNTWGPITQSAEAYFGWGDWMIGLLANWSAIAIILTMFPMSYLLDEKGLRFTTILCMILTFVGSGLRCITKDPDISTWLINVGQALNGISGAALIAGPALLAATWFPPNERATATAVSIMAMGVGMAGAFVLGPQFVQTPVYDTLYNVSLKSNGSNVTVFSRTNHTVLVNLEDIGNDINNLMYLECGIAACFLILTLLYFPRKPPKPPSKSASVERVDFKEAFQGILRFYQGTTCCQTRMMLVVQCPIVLQASFWSGNKWCLGKICKSKTNILINVRITIKKQSKIMETDKNKSLWLLVFGYTIPNGIFFNWGAVITVILTPVGVDQGEVGIIAAVSTVLGIVSAIVIARFSDIFMKHMKITLVSLYIIGLGGTVWFIIIVNKVIDFQIGYLWAASIILTMAINGSNPLFFELACETAYPIAEGITGGLMTWVNNIVGGIFLLMLLIPNIGTAWMNYCLAGGVGVGLLILFMFKESYSRINMDIIVEPPESVENPVGIKATEEE